MLEQAKELIGGGHIRRVVPPDVAACPEGGQRVDRRRHVQRLVGATVHQLQQLHRELDVAQPAAAEFDLAASDVGGHQLLHPPPHRLNFAHEILTLASGPHHRHHRGDVLLTQFRVTGGRAGFQQRLKLPGLGPLLVVGNMRVDGPHQLAVAAFRAQRGVHLEKGVRCQPHHLAGHPGRYRIGRLGNEDHVDVADVVQFARTAFAHRDDRQPRRCGVAADPGLGDRQRSRQCGVCYVGQVSTDSSEGQHGLVLDRRRQIQRGQHHHPVAVKSA